MKSSEETQALSPPDSRPEMSTGKKIKLYLLSGLLFLLVFALVFGIAELALRSWALSGSSESRDHVVETDSLPITFRPHYQGRIWDVPFRTNRYGFRGEEDFSASHGPEEVRVLSLGDSIGFGLGIPAKQHYTKVAQRLLKPLLPHRILRVVNAGGQGYSPSSYAVFLQEQGIALRPDLVVVEIELCNDITDEALIGRRFHPERPKLPSAVTGGRYVVAWDGNLLATYARGPYFWERTYVWTDLLRRFLNLGNRLSPNKFFQDRPANTYYTLGFDRFLLSSERLESGWQAMFDTLQATGRYLTEKQIPFLLLIMPSRYIYEDHAPAHCDFARSLVDRAASLSAQRGLPHLNMTEPIREGGGASLFFDFAHLTAEGNRVVGRRLSREMTAILGLKSEQPAPGQTPSNGPK